jgi:hypothetical protein
MQERELKQELRDTQARASDYQRALLTSQSDVLKNAVMKAFSDIGFE